MAAVVVDTNVLFSALLRDDSRFAETLLRSEQRFFVCETVLVELFRHRDRILRLSRLPDDDLARFYHVLLRRIDLFKEDLIPAPAWAEAFLLCKGIDESDTPHVALTLALDGLLWTGDKRLRDGLRKRGFDRFFGVDQDG